MTSNDRGGHGLNHLVFMVFFRIFVGAKTPDLNEGRLGKASWILLSEKCWGKLRLSVGGSSVKRGEMGSPYKVGPLPVLSRVITSLAGVINL